MSNWFVTGTDTDVGKSAVARAILHAARSRSLRAIGYKPVESGCPSDGFGPDTLLLAHAGQHAPECSYSLRDPVAPSLAAAREGVQIDVATITARASALQRQSELLLVEGAGGFLAPISSNATIADLAIALGFPLLIVAADKLGAINHSLLTIEAAERRGLEIAALILSAALPDSPELPGRAPIDDLENLTELRTHTKVVVLQIPRCYTDNDWLKAGESLLSAILLTDAKS